MFNVREDTGSIVGTVSQTYKLVDHKQTIHNTTTALEIVGLHAKPTHTILDNGSRIITEYLLKGKFQVMKKDDLLVKLVLFNSYDGSTAVQFLFGLFRVICSNGAMIGERTFGTFKWYHRSYFSLPDFVEQIQAGIVNYKQLALDKIQVLADKKITIDQGRQIVETLTMPGKGQILPKKHYDTVFDYFANPRYDVDKKNMNLWTLFNAFTYTLTHESDYNVAVQNDFSGKIFNVLQRKVA